MRGVIEAGILFCFDGVSLRRLVAFKIQSNRIIMTKHMENHNS
jgi:hypothetical protein